MIEIGNIETKSDTGLNHEAEERAARDILHSIASGEVETTNGTQEWATGVVFRAIMERKASVGVVTASLLQAAAHIAVGNWGVHPDAVRDLVDMALPPCGENIDEENIGDEGVEAGAGSGGDDAPCELCDAKRSAADAMMALTRALLDVYRHHGYFEEHGPGMDDDYECYDRLLGVLEAHQPELRFLLPGAAKDLIVGFLEAMDAFHDGDDGAEYAEVACALVFWMLDGSTPVPAPHVEPVAELRFHTTAPKPGEPSVVVEGICRPWSATTTVREHAQAEADRRNAKFAKTSLSEQALGYSPVSQ